MFMLKEVMELRDKVKYLRENKKELKESVSKLDIVNHELQKKLDEKNEHLARMHKLDIEDTKNTLRKEMQESLITSDLKRVEAVAKLATYEKMDTKDERKNTMQMLSKAIDALKKGDVTINNVK